MIVALDTETGGLDAATCALLSVSLSVLGEDLKPADSLDVFILPEPGLKVTAEAAAVNGYTPALWKTRGAVPLRDALRTIARWLPTKSDPLAHNAGFDKDFMLAAAKRTGIRIGLGFRWRCSMVAMAAVDDAFGMNFPNHKLDTLARVSGHWGEGYVRGDHQAHDDVEACAAGYRWLIGLMRRGGAPAQTTFATGG